VAAPARHTPKDRPGGGPVVVGVDGSARSVDALALADRLGAALGRDVLIAHVHPYGELSSLLSGGEYETLVRGAAESTFEQVREHLPSVSRRRMQLLSNRSPAAGLQALAQREHAGLIVIGSSDRSGIGRIFVGGTGERLLSGAPAPVAVAPAGFSAAGGGVRLVGCGFDGSEESHRAVAWATDLARRVPAQLRLLSVYERTLPASLAVGGGLATASVNDVLRRRRAETLARAVSELDAGIKVDGALLDGDARELLIRESGGLDLLVVGSRGYGPLRAVLLGSVSSALVRSAASPLVVVPGAAAGESAAQGTTSPRRIA
jgi:nucleotide-binding universal stress UspA family protein